MTTETLSETRAHGGTQGVYRHASTATGTDMTLAVFVPEHQAGAQLPVLWYLSGLTCTHANVMEKGEYRAACAEHGVIFVAPDTSPRGDDVPDSDGYDFGQGAGFYVDATQQPWARHYRMYDYIVEELPALIEQHFPVSAIKSIAGHSMGGHGAITIGLKNTAQYRSISAFSPISNPMQCPWGQKAFTAYLGADRESWRQYDACELLKAKQSLLPLLVDQGDADNFLEQQLQPQRLMDAAQASGSTLELRMQAAYDHSYFFISSFIEEHLDFHAQYLFKK